MRQPEILETKQNKKNKKRNFEVQSSHSHTKKTKTKNTMHCLCRRFGTMFTILIDGSIDHACPDGNGASKAASVARRKGAGAQGILVTSPYWGTRHYSKFTHLSGKRFPLRVLSTMITPPQSPAVSATAKFRRETLNDHRWVWPSEDLK